jgi:hypothetical protein
MMSDRPLSSWKIEQKLASPESSYTHTYHMLEHLVPLQYNLEPLFVWEHILSDDSPDYCDEINKRFVRKINDIFKLQLGLDKQESPFTSNEKYIDNVVVQKSTNGDIVQVRHGRKLLFEIELIVPERRRKLTLVKREKQQNELHKASSKQTRREEHANKISSLSNDNNHNATIPIPIINLFVGREKENNNKGDNGSKPLKKYKLAAKKNTKGELVIYVTILNRLNHIRYLDVDLRRESKDNVEAIDISNDRRNWLYLPNLRGLLRVIVDGVQQHQVQKRKELKKRRTRNVQLSHMLSNLSEHFPNNFPFLLYYDDFKKVLKRKAQEEKNLELFSEVEALKRIALELQYQIGSADILFLRYWVTKRYIELVMDYFGYSFKAGLIKNIRDIPYAKLKDYLLRNIAIMIDYLESELEIRKAEYSRWCSG